MLRQSISIFFTFLFMVTITLPSVIMMVDDSLDISMFLDFSEEEEEKGNEKNKEFEIALLDILSNSEDEFQTKKIEKPGYYFKTYPKPHLNLISPPPEYLI